MKPKQTLLIVLLFCISFFMQSQTNEIEKANKLMDSTEVLMQHSKFRQALELNKKVLSIYKKGNASNADKSKIYGLIGNIYISLRVLDSTKFYTDKGFLLLKNEDDNKEAAGLLNYNLGTLYAIKGDFDASLVYLRKALKAQLESVGVDHLNTGRTYNTLANISMLKRDFEKSLAYSNKAIDIFEKSYGENHSSTAGLYNNRGNVFYHKEDYKKAAYYYEKSLKINKTVLGENHSSLADMYGNLGNVYREQGNYDKSIDYLVKAINIYKKRFGEFHPNMGDFYNSIGLSYKNINDYKRASENFNKARVIWEKNLGELHQYVGYVYANLGNIDFELGKYKSSLNYYYKALTVFEASSGKEHLDVAKALVNIGRLQIRTKAYEKAVITLKKALLISEKTKELVTIDIYLRLAEVYSYKSQNNKAKDFFKKATSLLFYKDNDSLDFSNVASIEDLNDFFETRIIYFKNLQAQTGKDQYADSLTVVYDRFLKYQDHVQQSFSRKASKNFRISSSYNLYEESIKNLIKRGRKEELIKAFEVSEKVKARILSENFYRIDAQKLSLIPDSILTKEGQLERRLSEIEKKIFELNNTNNNQKISSLKDTVFKIKNEQDKLQDDIKALYPEYYTLTHDHYPISVSKVQELLDENQSLVKYFVGDKSIFVFHISKKGYTVKQINKNFPLKKWISSMREGIYGYWLQSNGKKKSIDTYNQEYKKAAYNLYTKLLAPISNELTENLIIIPDGILSFIPFSALLTEQTEGEVQYKDFPYLLKKHLISYDYSSVIFKELLGKKIDTKGNAIAFAPSFDYLQLTKGITLTRNELGPLKFNVPEATVVSEMFNGDLYVGDKATKSNFINKAKNYKVIHLSTHAKSNDTFGDYSYIAFNKNQDSLNIDDKLYVSELYGLNLNAEMVVLSACETGLGELKRGEGMISLARAFTYAGAKSTVTSLWSVNDAQTKELMVLFYKNLKKGMKKDVALHQAKLNYIENETLAAPYFWAGFIPAGNMEAIHFSNHTYLYYLGAGLILLVLLLVFRRRKKT